MAMKEISSQSAIDHKEKTHNTHVYGECVLFICVYLNMAIGSSKINFSDIVHYVTGHTDTKASFYYIMYVCRECLQVYLLAVR